MNGCCGRTSGAVQSSSVGLGLQTSHIIELIMHFLTTVDERSTVQMITDASEKHLNLFRDKQHLMSERGDLRCEELLSLLTWWVKACSEYTHVYSMNSD